jgi:polyisoprenyl-phosphate glycosyltransferase
MKTFRADNKKDNGTTPAFSRVSRVEASDSSERVAIIIPVLNDWDSLDVLLPALDEALGSRGWVGEILLVNDGSVLPITETLRRRTYLHLESVEVLHLLRNLGHQRAIAVGLTHLYKTRSGLRAIVIMDGDGEDKPEDVPLLIEELTKYSGCSVLFAARTKRLEPWRFQVMYRLYRFLHWLLTGINVRIGNFSAVSPSALPHLVSVSELWNHYAASVCRSRLPMRTLPIARGKRYRGQSQMSLPGLILHGLSAISVFSDIVGVRLLVAGILATLVGSLTAFVLLALRSITTVAIPGWAMNTVGLFVVVLLQSVLLMLGFVFTILNLRSHVNVIPLRDAAVFVGNAETLGMRYDVEILEMHS